MTKGYYGAYTITDDVIYGGSYAIKMANIDFITWKKNHETGEFWVKFHSMSGKEIRLKITHGELNEVLQTWGNKDIKYGDENEFEND